MLNNLSKSLAEHRNKLMPALVSLALLGGVISTIALSGNASADYSVGCGYGYSGFGTPTHHGTFGYGSSYGYGFVNNSAFGFGYGFQVCPISVNPVTLPAGTVGTPYSAAITGAYGVNTVTPVTWLSASLGNGLSLSPSGVVSGTPTASGTFTFQANFNDANGQTSPAVSLSMTVAPSTVLPTPTTTSTTTPTTTTTVTPTPTTTVTPTTVPVVAPSMKPVFQSVAGRPAYMGATRMFVIKGLNLAGIRVSSNGAAVRILSDAPTLLKVNVTPTYGKHWGVYILTGRTKYGVTSLRYSLVFNRQPLFTKLVGMPAYIGKTTQFTMYGHRLAGVKVSSNGGKVQILKDTATMVQFNVTPVVGWRPGVYVLTFSDRYGWNIMRYNQIWPKH